MTRTVQDTQDPQDTTTVVHTTYGPVRGTLDGPVHVWKGVRYASVPAGRRFRAPVAPEPWSEVVDADRFGPVQPQSRVADMPLGDDVVMAEDCLSLNVWSPAAGAAGKPVMVWIHGGANFRGASSQPGFDGRALAENGDVVVVTVNYRLGVFGFVDFSALSTDHRVFDPNVALLDLIAALRWVQSNIAAFGGDPRAVTLFGESAGGGAVTTLMTMPAAQGLFHRAIAESSPVTSVHDRERATHIAHTFLDILGGTGDPADRLATATTDELLAASEELFERIPRESPGTAAYAPTVDGELLPDYPATAFWNGTAARIPLIIGTNRDEAKLFDRVTSSRPRSAYLRAATRKDVSTGSGDFAFRLPALWIVEAHSRYAPTWLYRFDYARPVLDAFRIGAGPGTELPYVFGNIPSEASRLPGRRVTDREVVDRVQHRWLEFARHAVPSGRDGEPEWDVYDRYHRATLVIDARDRVVPDLDAALREAWGERALAAG